MHQSEEVKANGIVLDLSVLHGRSAAAIAQKVGRRGMILPMCCFTDTIVAVERRLGSRESRLRKLLAKLRTLVFEMKIPARIPEWRDGREIGIDPIHFLSHDSAQVVRIAEARIADHVEQVKPSALRLEETQRQRATGGFEIAEPEASWLYHWAVKREDVSKGKLASYMAECMAAAGCHHHTEPYSRAVAVIGCLDFLHKYGRRRDLATITDIDAISNYHDWIYLIWALRFDAYLWTTDNNLRSLCSVAKQVWRRSGLNSLPT